MFNNKYPKIAHLVNIPSPYRVLLFDMLAKKLGECYKVFYCASIESNREWKIPTLNHNHLFLKSGRVKIFGRSFYLNADTWKQLKKFEPDIIATGGFNPTMLIGWLYSRLNNKKHLINTDAWEWTEKKLTRIHINIRKYIYKNVSAFLPVSKKGELNLISNYGIPEEKIFIGHYAIENERFRLNSLSEKKYDVMFSGQFIERKLPLFFVEVCKKLFEKKKDGRLLLLGDGPLKQIVLEKLKAYKLNYYYPGFVQQEKLPNYFALSRIFLFPTQSDAWGVVVNEACAAGLPVITCDNTGSAGDLVLNGYNGYILPLEIDIWVEHILKLLNDPVLYNKFSMNSLKRVDDFTVEKAGNGFLKAIEYASQK